MAITLKNGIGIGIGIKRDGLSDSRVKKIKRNINIRMYNIY